MCYAKPGPRCSGHAWKDYQKARQTGDQNAIDEAKREWLHTPKGIEHLRGKGLDDVADRMQTEYDQKLTEYRQLKTITDDLKRQHADWASTTPAVDINPDDLYSTAGHYPAPDGERINAKVTPAVQRKRDARDFSDFGDLPVVRGTDNPTSWTSMGDHREDFNHAKIENVKNGEPNAQMLAMGITWHKPDKGFWSAGAEDPEDSYSMTPNPAGVPGTWWMRMQSEDMGGWDDDQDARDANTQSNLRSMQSETMCVVPRADAAVLRVETREHYQNVVRRYYNPKNGSINYEKMHKDGFDGFSMSDAVAHSWSHREPSKPFTEKIFRPLYGWDGDSTVWFNKHSFDVVIPKKLPSLAPTTKESSKNGRSMMSEDDALADLRKRLLG